MAEPEPLGASNPLLQPCPLKLKIGRTRLPSGEEVAVMVVLHPAGELTMFLTKAELGSWLQTMGATHRKMTGLVIPPN